MNRTKLRIARTRGGRSYDYRDNMKIPIGWKIRDEQGELFDSIEDHDRIKADRKDKAKKKMEAAKRKAARKIQTTEE